MTLHELEIGMVARRGRAVRASGIRLVPKRRRGHDSLCWGDLRTIAGGVGVAEPIRVSVKVLD